MNSWGLEVPVNGSHLTSVIHIQRSISHSQHIIFTKSPIIEVSGNANNEAKFWMWTKNMEILSEKFPLFSDVDNSLIRYKNYNYWCIVQSEFVAELRELKIQMINRCGSLVLYFFSLQFHAEFDAVQNKNKYLIKNAIGRIWFLYLK